MEYKDKIIPARFVTQDGKYFACLKDILIDANAEGDTICFPPYKSIKLNLSNPERMKSVRKLIIPETVLLLKIKNTDFPNLEEMEVRTENFRFYEGSKCLARKESNGDTVLLNVWSKDEAFEVPDEVSIIARGAFRGTKCDIICSLDMVSKKETPPTISELEEIFCESAWLEKCKSQGYAVFKDKILLLKPIQTQCFRIPDGITDIVGNYAIDCEVLELDEELSDKAMDEICKRVTAKTIRVYGRIRPWHVELIKTMDAKPKLEGNPDEYTVQDDILYTKDRKKLLCYMCDEKKASFHIPDETECIGSYAFAYCKNIRHLVLPANLKNMKTYTFNNAEFDCVEFPENMEYIEFMEQSVFCNAKIKEVIIHGGTRYVGSRLLEGAVNWEMIKITLHEGVQELGPEAFFDRISFMYKVINKTTNGAKKYISIPSSMRYLHNASLRGAFTHVEVSKNTKNVICAVDTSNNIIIQRREDNTQFMIPDSLSTDHLDDLNYAWNDGANSFQEAYRQMIIDVVSPRKKAKKSLPTDFIRLLWFAYQNHTDLRDVCLNSMQKRSDDVWYWLKDKIKGQEYSDLVYGCVVMSDFEEEQLAWLLKESTDVQIRAAVLEKQKEKKKEKNLKL